MTVLDVRNVKKFFGDKIILDDVSFSVDAGEIFGIVGLSGGGKSTLAKIIARLIPSDGGKIFLCGEEISSSTGNNFYRNMQMIFQNPEDSFNPRMTLGASISEPIKNFGVKANVADLLRQVGLTADYALRYPREVSGGECQRAAIARAISVEPRLLICDEATSALDVTTQKQIIALIKNLCAARKISCIFITHDLSIVNKIASRVLVLENSRLKKISESQFKEEIEWSI